MTGTSNLVDEKIEIASLKKHTESIKFNSAGKWSPNDDSTILFARANSGNYAILPAWSSATAKATLILYDVQSTSWTRVTSEPTLSVTYYTL